MAGIYIHIPFCRQACLYCGFHFSTSVRETDRMLEAIVRELRMQKDFFAADAGGSRSVETVYVGGGTPSVIGVTAIRGLLDEVREVFSVTPAAEYTLEVNPDDLTAERLRSYREAGVNRLSVGIQSFFTEDLAWMNRAHDAPAAEAALEMVPAAGFTNYSCDLIYGYPMLTDEKWVSNIRRVIRSGAPHVSCYAMTVESRTALERRIRTGKAAPMDEEQAARQFTILAAMLGEAGYEQYEISNFAKPGYRARHNSHYWDGTPYLGIGPSAHSFRGVTRQWNVANNARYIREIFSGRVPFTAEHLTDVMRLNEYVMTSLRTVEGCDLTRVGEGWGVAERRRLERDSGRFARAGHLSASADRLVLTPAGRLFADGIAAALFREEGS
jgi:oxygen-independent coproporphyrinogen-3 oxidase